MKQQTKTLTLGTARRRIGAAVSYRAFPDGPIEDGVIVGVRGKHVIVKYVSSATPKATRPESLTLLMHRWENPDGVIETDGSGPNDATCGSCGRSWDDSVSTCCTPVPSGRCPFEYDHEEAEHG